MLFEVKYRREDGAEVTHRLESSINNLEEARKQFRAECNERGWVLLGCVAIEERDKRL